MKRLDADGTFELISDCVAKECRRRKVKGVFAMTQLSNDAIRWTLVLRNTAIRIGEEDSRDANILAVALMVLAMVVVHRKNTEMNPVSLFGELESTGGRLSADKEFAYAFSGSTQEVDDELMQLAEAFHKSLK